ELLAEEERAKRKAEKKKLKKKKQKDRKKREKLGQEQKSKQEAELVGDSVGTEHSQSSTAEEEEGLVDTSRSPGPKGSSGKDGGGQGARAEELEDELDLSCTFVSKARQKAGVRLPVPSKEKPARTKSAEPSKKVPEKVPKAEPLDMGAVEKSLILAGRGNEVAQQGQYGKAVQAFTEAVKLNPQEHRLFGNRSYCYEKLGRYEEALRDAQESLRLQPGWPKGFFRKGKALRGLQRYTEAICTFEELLRRNGANTEAAAQLQACQALLHVSVPTVPCTPQPCAMPAAVGAEPILPSAGTQACRNRRDVDTSGTVTVVNSRSQARGQVRPADSSPLTLPHTHPARDCYPLWVGNITSQISEKVLQGAFGRFGEIRFIRLLPGRRCAFINYVRKKAAEAAYAAMQDAEVEGSKLVLQLKHPSHATPSPLQHP
ncbi:TTC31 protein, partial [Bucco capensis]|nr:TTC31 protein [Bucco capensis]